MSRGWPIAMALALALAGCGEDRVPDPADRAPDSVEHAPGSVEHAPGSVEQAADSADRAPDPSADADTVRFVPPALEGEREWTAGVVQIRPERGRAGALLRAVRVASHERHDRVVWEFAHARPGVHVEYVDEPVRRCGSGRAVRLPGDGWLEVRFEPAAAHVDGEVTFEPERLVSDLPVVLEVVSTCDFEGVVTWVAAVASPEPYRVVLLDDPARVAVDVRHPIAGGDP